MSYNIDLAIYLTNCMVYFTFNSVWSCHVKSIVDTFKHCYVNILTTKCPVLTYNGQLNKRSDFN